MMSGLKLVCALAVIACLCDQAEAAPVTVIDYQPLEADIMTEDQAEENKETNIISELYYALALKPLLDHHDREQQQQQQQAEQANNNKNSNSYSYSKKKINRKLFKQLQRKAGSYNKKSALKAKIASYHHESPTH